MKVCVTTPSVAAPNGGVRLILDFAAQLRVRGHDVMILNERESGRSIYNGIITLSPERYRLQKFDLTIITSPHSIWVADYGNSVVWLQMLEHLFKPHDINFTALCRKVYTHHRVITNAEYIAEYINKIGDPVAKNAIAITTWLPKYFNPVPGLVQTDSVLIESPAISHNPTKDKDGIALRLANKYKRKYGYKICGYGARHPVNAGLLNIFLLKPELRLLNALYTKCKILLKTTVYDGRSCSPIEAAKFGCVTVRGIDYGDEHLTSSFAYISNYDEKAIEENFLRALTEDLTEKAKRAKEFADGYTFDKFIGEFNRAAKTDL